MSENETETPADAPDKVYICPACGQRYDEPTTCANGHPPTEAIEYDRATVNAADNGDTEAQSALAQTELAATGGMAGVEPAEATPLPPTVPAPVPAEAVDPQPAESVPADPAPVEVSPNGTPLADAAAGALSNIESAANAVFASIQDARTKLGL